MWSDTPRTIHENTKHDRGFYENGTLFLILYGTIQTRTIFQARKTIGVTGEAIPKFLGPTFGILA